MPYIKVVRLPNSQFIFWLSKTYGKFPSDNCFEDMNPWEKLWLYESWLFEFEQKIQTERNLAILTGSFSNYDMAKQMMKDADPDYQDPDAEETAKKLHESIIEEEKENSIPNKKKRKKKRVVE